MSTERSRTAAGIALLATGAFSVQFGASLATLLLPVFGIWLVVFFRYCVMAIMHCSLSIQHLRDIEPRNLWWGVGLAIPLLGMNVSIYAAFQHIGLGLAVTIELIGPILLAVITSLNRWGWVAAALAFVGMVCASGPTASSDPTGIFFALLAALAWAVYLVMSRKAGAKLPGLVPLAISSLCGLAVLIPMTLAIAPWEAVSLPLLGIALAAGLLSSAIPYAADLLALRRLPLSVASNLMSLHPLAAVLFGALVLGERLGPIEYVGLVLICLSNVLVVSTASRKAVKRRLETSGIPLAAEDASVLFHEYVADLPQLGEDAPIFPILDEQNSRE